MLLTGETSSRGRIGFPGGGHSAIEGCWVVEFVDDRGELLWWDTYRGDRELWRSLFESDNVNKSLKPYYVNLMTMMGLFFTCLLLILLILFQGCRQPETETFPMLVDINTALKLSGENRPELERVLSSYKDAQPDALKYQAAKYLICNKLIDAVRLLNIFN